MAIENHHVNREILLQEVHVPSPCYVTDVKVLSYDEPVPNKKTTKTLLCRDLIPLGLGTQLIRDW